MQNNANTLIFRAIALHYLRHLTLDAYASHKYKTPLQYNIEEKRAQDGNVRLFTG